MNECTSLKAMQVVQIPAGGGVVDQTSIPTPAPANTIYPSQPSIMSLPAASECSSVASAPVNTSAIPSGSISAAPVISTPITNECVATQAADTSPTQTAIQVSVAATQSPSLTAAAPSVPLALPNISLSAPVIVPPAQPNWVLLGGAAVGIIALYLLMKPKAVSA